MIDKSMWTRAGEDFDDVREQRDELMKRHYERIETIRQMVDAGTLTNSNRQLLNALGLPWQYDKRTP